MKTRPPLARTFFHAALLVALFLAPMEAGPASPPAAGPAPARVIAVADVHGAYDQLVAILHDVGLTSDGRAWAGGDATFVQTGDVVDRGARTRECLDLLMALERQAPESGGKVIPLLGNHEVMNVIGDVRYVTKEIFRTFAAEDAERRREKAYEDYLGFLEKHKGHGHADPPPSDGEARRAWIDAHPPGFFEFRDAFGPDGEYGKWVRSHHAVVQIGDGLFVHGGLSPTLEFDSVRQLDERVMADLPAFDAMWKTLVGAGVVWRYMTFAEAVLFASEELAWRQSEGPIGAFEAKPAVVRLLGYKTWITVSPDGPLWYRGLATQPEGALDAGLTAMLNRLNARYIVSGHSVVASKQITTRLGSRIFLIDTGMLGEVYAGRGSALEIRDGRFVAHQVDATPRLLQAPEAAKAAGPGR